MMLYILAPTEKKSSGQTAIFKLERFLLVVLTILANP